MTASLPSIVDLKGQAKRLRSQLEIMGTRVSHSKSLELVAHQYGCRDWNTLCATARARPAMPLNIGDPVRGRYLSEPFTGRVVGIQMLKGERFQIALYFDEAVDVVHASSFSNRRKRVSCIVDSSGTTREKTSNGVPHLVLDGR